MPLNNKKKLEPANALQRLRDLCDRGEYCTSEVLEKMRKWGLTPSQSSNIVDLLKADRYIDDARYARSLAYSKAMYSAWGKIKIRLYLIKKRITAHEIADALAEIDEEAYEKRLADVLYAKARQLGEEADTYEGRSKIYRYGVSKGYESTLVASIIRKTRYS